MGHKKRKVIRRDPKSDDPYLKLLVKVSSHYDHNDVPVGNDCNESVHSLCVLDVVSCTDFWSDVQMLHLTE